MKKSMLLLVAVCALLVFAQPSFARTYEDNLPYCENWVGKWSIVTNHGTDNVTFDTMCLKDQDCFIRPDIQLCQATGKRESDNHTIMISLISFNYDFFAYYEFATWDNTTTIGASTPADTIPISGINLLCNTFIGDIGIDGIDDFGLKSGKKLGPDNCTDNQTCELQKIIPGKISKLSAFVQPIMSFVIIGSGDPAFIKGDKAAFDSDAIKPLISLKISTKIIIAIAFVNPFALETGDVEVSVGDCVGTITVK